MYECKKRERLKSKNPLTANNSKILDKDRKGLNILNLPLCILRQLCERL
jgi:hypothetical protein